MNVTKKKNRRMLLFGGLVTVAMFGFGFLMVPLYSALCTKIGINGKTESEAVPLADPSEIDNSRTLTVQFVASTNRYLPWDFRANTPSITMHPGENKLVYFYAKNLTDHGMVVQAIPSVAPSDAAPYLKKTECFCFTQQYLAGHKSMLMPVLFHIEPNLPKYITTLTLSYTMFDADAFAKKTLGIPGKLSG